MPRAAMSVATSVLTSPLRKAGEHALALVLRLVAVDRFGGDAGLTRPRTTLSAPCLVRVKTSARSIGSLLQHVDEQCGLRGAIDADDALLDALDRRGGRRHRDLDRIAQHLRGELGDVARHGGREQQRLPLGRQLGDDLADVVDEAHVEHAVGFVEHEDTRRSSSAQRVALHEIEQPAGRGDEHVDAVEQRAHLRAHRHAADGERGTAAADGGRRCGSCRGSGRTVRASGSAPARGSSCAAAAAGSAARWLRIGSAKAAVLPVPVCAMPRRRGRRGRCGMVCAWIGVGVSVFFFGECARDRLGEAEVDERSSMQIFLCMRRRRSRDAKRRGPPSGRNKTPRAIWAVDEKGLLRARNQLTDFNRQGGTHNRLGETLFEAGPAHAARLLIELIAPLICANHVSVSRRQDRYNRYI